MIPSEFFAPSGTLSSVNFRLGAKIAINKPIGWTSFDVVKKVRFVTRAKTGHAGTLDPLASGLLILCTGPMTRQLNQFMDATKEYTGTFELGITTPSYDRETEPDAHYPVAHISPAAIYEVAARFSGNIFQAPPVFSAVKIDGKRSYLAARMGTGTRPDEKEVRIDQFEITGIQMPEVSFRVVCSKGTYIRSLVHDAGKALHSGARLNSLCRTRIGDVHLSQAWEIDSFVEAVRFFRQKA